MNPKILLLLLAWMPGCLMAAERNDLGARPAPARTAAEGRLIVKFKTSAAAPAAGPAVKRAADRIARIAARTRIALAPMRRINADLQLVEVDRREGLEDAAERLRRDPEVEFAVLDRRRFAHAAPNDPIFPAQWYLQAAQPAAIRAADAWSISTGSLGIVVAVLDTGVRFEHPDLGRADLGGRLLPGYDFVSGESSTSFLVANDGDGWDPDPSDPGDWISASDQADPEFKDCPITNSSWHGTRTAGILAAQTDNALGVAGVGWQTWLLPVRVLGKCGGFDSDIMTAMRWAAGLSVEGVPDNPYPAKILNLSLGSADSTQCQAYAQVVQELSAQGVLVIASAGNAGGEVDEPADCPGVLAVGGLRHAGTKVGYSNLGAPIGISAPAGNCVNLSGPCLFSLDTTSNTGLTVPVASIYTDQTITNLGTSFAAPQVAGVAALMLAVNQRLDPGLLIRRIQQGSAPFPAPIDASAPLPICHSPASAADIQASECVCTTSVCGAGMLDAQGALQEALRPIAAIRAQTGSGAGKSIRLDAGASSAACGRNLVGFAWTAADDQGRPIALGSPSGAATSLAAPAFGGITATLTVTDDRGAIDSGGIRLGANGAPAPITNGAPAAACPRQIYASVIEVAATGGGAGGGGGGGGGSIDAWLLIGAGLLVANGSRRTRALQ